MAKRIERVERRAARAVVQDFQPDYGYVRADLRRIAFLAVAFLSLLIVLSFIVD